MGIRRRKKPINIKPALLTREMTDTEYNRVFKKPLQHNFGRSNTRPVNDENYLKTFNIKAKKTEVMPSATYRAMTSPIKKKKDTKFQKPIIDTKVPKINSPTKKRSPSIGLQVSPIDIKNEQPTKLENEDMKRQPTMFEALSWPDPELEQLQTKVLEARKLKEKMEREKSQKHVHFVQHDYPPIPKPSDVYLYKPSERKDLDPKNYSALPSAFLEQITPAGIPVPKSEPVSHLLSLSSK